MFLRVNYFFARFGPAPLNVFGLEASEHTAKCRISEMRPRNPRHSRSLSLTRCLACCKRAGGPREHYPHIFATTRPRRHKSETGAETKRTNRFRVVFHPPRIQHAAVVWLQESSHFPRATLAPTCASVLRLIEAALLEMCLHSATHIESDYCASY